MKLFTKDIDRKLFAQYPKGNNLEEQIGAELNFASVVSYKNFANIDVLVLVLL